MLGFFKVIGSIFALLLVVFFFGPRPDLDQTLSFDAERLGDDIDAYLADSEQSHTDLRDGASKELVWANPLTRSKTDYCIVYLHGFSASKQETAPLSQNLASELGANLFLTRLAGHGRSGPAMSEPRMADWLDDVAEAIAIGERIGERLILVSASTGGTLSTWAAAQPQFAEKIDGMIMVSPNYAIRGASTGLMNMPWAETLLPMIMGAERSFEPINERQAQAWTSSYPSAAVFPMAALLRVVEGLDKSRITTPTLFIYSDADTVVVPDKTDQVVAAWGGPKRVIKIENSSDPQNHVIAGDILSPNTTEVITQAAIDWLKSL